MPLGHGDPQAYYQPPNATSTHAACAIFGARAHDAHGAPSDSMVPDIAEQVVEGTRNRAGVRLHGTPFEIFHSAYLNLHADASKLENPFLDARAYERAAIAFLEQAGRGIGIVGEEALEQLVGYLLDTVGLLPAAFQTALFILLRRASAHGQDVQIAYQ